MSDRAVKQDVVTAKRIDNGQVLTLTRTYVYRRDLTLGETDWVLDEGKSSKFRTADGGVAVFKPGGPPRHLWVTPSSGEPFQVLLTRDEPFPKMSRAELERLGFEVPPPPPEPRSSEF